MFYQHRGIRRIHKTENITFTKDRNSEMEKSASSALNGEAYKKLQMIKTEFSPYLA